MRDSSFLLQVMYCWQEGWPNTVHDMLKKVIYVNQQFQVTRNPSITMFCLNAKWTWKKKSLSQYCWNPDFTTYVPYIGVQWPATAQNKACFIIS